MGTRSRLLPLLVVLASPAVLAPSASARTIDVQGRQAQGSFVFALHAVKGKTVRSARLLAGGRSTRVSTVRVRRALRTGELRLAASGRAAQTRRPRLRLTVTGAKSSGRRKTTKPRPVEPVPTEPAPTPEPTPTPTPDPGPVPPAPTWQRVGGFETGNFSEFDVTGMLGGTIGVTSEQAYEGTRSAKVTYVGGEPISFQRTAYDVAWETGTDVWYGAALHIPRLASWCWWNPIRWDNYPTYGGTGSGDIGGLHIDTDRKMYLTRAKFGTAEDDLIGPVTIPEGRWFWIEVHQRLSPVDGEALSEVFLDGVRVGSSTRPNTYGRRVDRIHYGDVSIAPHCSTTGSVYVDRASISSSQLGPR